MLASICRCCGQPGLVLLAQAGRFFGPAVEKRLSQKGWRHRVTFVGTTSIDKVRVAAFSFRSFALPEPR
jgi:hypothetical protein